MAERDKELQLLEKRFAELADRAWQQNLFVFTGFLSLAEQEVLWRSAAKAGVHIELYAEWMVQSGVWAGSEIQRNSDMKSRFRSVR